MAYEPTVWVDGETPLTAERLNKVEAGILGAHELAGEAKRAKGSRTPSKAQWDALLKRVEALEEKLGGG